MSLLVTVVCRECRGKTDPLTVCGWCLGQCHECVDRAPDGGVPEGFTEWIVFPLPEVPVIENAYPRCC